MAGYEYVNSDIARSPESLTEALKKDRRRCEAEDLQTTWYHGKMTRQAAENILQDAIKKYSKKDTNGIFLVRDSTASPQDFSLSLLYDQRCYHFFIKRMKEGFYQIDGGPIIQGLDKLIEHYMEAKDKLPTILTHLCRGKPPPAHIRTFGPTNLLHTAVIEGNTDLVKKILIHPLCPNVQSKNADGNTALHEAASLGLDKVVSLLLSHMADVKMKDQEGLTPLHKACASNRVSVCEMLVNHDVSCVQERSPITGMVPLHVASLYGYLQCVKVLLNAGAALLPRNYEDETPIHLAERYRRNSCVHYLQSWKGLGISLPQSRWLHEGLDRPTTEQLIQDQGLYDGIFLVSSTETGHFRLSLCHQEKVRHFKIVLTTYREETVYYIDNGPYHQSLELLVDYHVRFADGCQVLLKHPVAPANGPKQANYANAAPPKPTKPPLPASLPIPANGLKQPDYAEPIVKPTKPAKPPLRTSPQTPEHNKKPSKPAKPALPPSPPVADGPRPAMSRQSSQNSSPRKQSLSSSVDPVKTPPTPEPSELKAINKNQLKLGKEIGAGEYGSVLRGTLTLEKKKLFGKDKVVEVAVKTFHNVSSLDDFKQEAHVMQSLKHDYIVELLGVCHGHPLMLVEEFVPMGSMLSFLEDHPELINVKRELYLWAAQIAEGMMYLETQRLVHRDLAARNILLRNLHHVKISDFGLSRAMGTDKDYYKASKGGRWPIKWYAPESVNFGHFSHASDVWSFGVTLWEMFSFGLQPYEGKTGFEVINFVEEGCRLPCPEQCPSGVYQVMLQCWQAKPSDRPTFQELNRHFDEEPEYASAKEIKKNSKLKN